MKLKKNHFQASYHRFIFLSVLWCSSAVLHPCHFKLQNVALSVLKACVHSTWVNLGLGVKITNLQVKELGCWVYYQSDIPAYKSYKSSQHVAKMLKTGAFLKYFLSLFCYMKSIHFYNCLLYLHIDEVVNPFFDLMWNLHCNMSNCV